MRDEGRLAGWFYGWLDALLDDYDKAKHPEEKALIQLHAVEELTHMALCTEGLVHHFIGYARKNNRCKWRNVIHATTLQGARALVEESKQFRPNYQYQLVAVTPGKPQPPSLPSNHKWLCPFLGLEDVVV